jgi:peptidoglycan/xylan/chitin deacetylase (PgdA/CDA1 family)
VDKLHRLPIFLTVGIVFEVLLIVGGMITLVVQANTPGEAAVAENSPSLFPDSDAVAVRSPAPRRPTGVYLPAPTAAPTVPPTPWPTGMPSSTPLPSATPSPTPSPRPWYVPPSRVVPVWDTPPLPVPPTRTPRPTQAAFPTDAAAALPLPEQADVPILLYHYVEELPADADTVRQNLTVSPAEFAAQLQYLADNGYHTITLEHLYDHLWEGLPLPDKPLILTFDDGYRDAYEVVFPLLKRYGFVGTFFIFTAPVEDDNPAYLTWSMIEEMSWAGMEIASHGNKHIGMVGLSHEALVDEMHGSKTKIESQIGRPVHFFCYPYGFYDTQAIEVLQSSGYWGAVTTYPSRYHVRGGLYELGRLRMGPGMWAGGIAALLEP